MNCTPFSIQLPFSDNTKHFSVRIHKSKKVTIEQVLDDKTRFPQIELPIETDTIYKIRFSGGYPNAFSLGISGLDYLNDLDETDNDDKLSIIKGRGIVMIAGDTPFQEVWFKATEIEGEVAIRYKSIIQPFL